MKRSGRTKSRPSKDRWVVVGVAAVEHAQQAGVAAPGATAVGGDAASNPVTESDRRDACHNAMLPMLPNPITASI